MNMASGLEDKRSGVEDKGWVHVGCDTSPLVRVCSKLGDSSAHKAVLD